MIAEYFSTPENDKVLIKYLKRAIFEQNQSKAINRKIGACLVPKNSDVPIGGYNGPARGIPETDNWDRFDRATFETLWELAERKHGSYPFNRKPKTPNQKHPKVDYDPRYLLGYTSGNGLHLMIDSHGERNAIFNAARAGISTVGANLYLTCNIPCKECTIAILQSGIARVYATKSISGTEEDTNPSEYAFRLSRWLYNKSSTTTLVEYPPELLEVARNG